jgi:hypothetical protein
MAETATHSGMAAGRDRLTIVVTGGADHDAGGERSINRCSCQVIGRTAAETQVDEIAMVGDCDFDSLGNIEIARATAGIGKHAIAAQRRPGAMP